jgi:hypothetical protein
MVGLGSKQLHCLAWRCYLLEGMGYTVLKALRRRPKTWRTDRRASARLEQCRWREAGAGSARSGQREGGGTHVCRYIISLLRCELLNLCRIESGRFCLCLRDRCYGPFACQPLLRGRSRNLLTTGQAARSERSRIYSLG